MADREYERGPTYIATYRRGYCDGERLMLFFTTPDGMERMFVKKLSDEKGFNAVRSAIKALNPKAEAFFVDRKVNAKPGVECRLVLSAENHTFVQFVNTNSSPKHEVEDDAASRFNEAWDEVPF